jgi:hypothetical protein
MNIASLFKVSALYSTIEQVDNLYIYSTEISVDKVPQNSLG